mmetsp:Transcript_62176/g.115386  ORF Transcript_62176/g.115386 Transcript_62176/m.115386 type:complete len:144 (-) Transcript_62176:168-599(-)
MGCTHAAGMAAAPSIVSQERLASDMLQDAINKARAACHQSNNSAETESLGNSMELTPARKRQGRSSTRPLAPDIEVTAAYREELEQFLTVIHECPSAFAEFICHERQQHPLLQEEDNDPIVPIAAVIAPMLQHHKRAQVVMRL